MPHHVPNTKRLTSILIKDSLAILVILVALATVHYYIRPFRRGFFCDDETIRYPHKQSTVSSGVLYITGTFINLSLILSLEYYNLLKFSKTEEARENRINENFWKLYIANVYCRCLSWIFGALSSELFTDISKVSAGRLRPHFINVCAPTIMEDGPGESLTDFCEKPHMKYKYIERYECSGKDARDIRLSFMSGHSSYGAYSAIHAALYMHSAMDIEDFGMLKCFAQVATIASAFYVGLSRISDYKHHWQDVLVGLTQGTMVAIVVCKYMWPAIHKNFFANAKLNNSRTSNDEDLGRELDRVRY